MSATEHDQRRAARHASAAERAFPRLARADLRRELVLARTRCRRNTRRCRRSRRAAAASSTIERASQQHDEASAGQAAMTTTVRRQRASACRAPAPPTSQSGATRDPEHALRPAARQLQRLARRRARRARIARAPRGDDSRAPRRRARSAAQRAAHSAAGRDDEQHADAANQARRQQEQGREQRDDQHRGRARCGAASAAFQATSAPLRAAAIASLVRPKRRSRARERGDRRVERRGVEVGPQRIGEIELGVGELPEQEIADALLAAGADEEIGLGRVAHRQVAARALVLARPPAPAATVARASACAACTMSQRPP